MFLIEQCYKLLGVIKLTQFRAALLKRYLQFVLIMECGEDTVLRIVNKKSLDHQLTSLIGKVPYNTAVISKSANSRNDF